MGFEFLKKIKWNTILVSAVIALLGLIVLTNPEAAALSICSLVGWFLVIGGVLTLIAYFSMQKINYVLFMGLIQLLPGLYIVIRPDVLVSFVSLMLGIILLVYGLACIRESMENKRFGYQHWWLNLVVGIITVLLALCVIVNPFATGSAVMMFAGAAMLVHGISNIISIAVISNDIRKMM